MSGQQQAANNGISARVLDFVVMTTIGAGAVSAEVFLHRRFGRRYLSFQAAAVLLLVPLYASFWSGHDIGPLLVFLPVYLLMVIRARLGILYRHWRRDNEHSLYNGWPAMLSRSAYQYERLFKQFVEPLLVVIVGFMVGSWNPPLGGYFLFMAFCLFLHSAQMNNCAQRQVLDLHDAVIEQQQRAEQFRGLRRC